MKFKVVTDHSSLRWLQTLKEPEGRLARWAIQLQACDFEIIHRAGNKHQNTDGLSRLPIVCLLLDEAEKLYDLISHPDQWDELPQEMQSMMRSLAENTKIIKNQL